MLVTVDNLGQWGVLRDGLPHELPQNAWSAGRNVRFREGYAEKFAGDAAAFGDSIIAPLHVAPLQVGATRWWVEAGTSAIHSVDTSGVHAQIGAGYSADYWTSTTLAGVLVLNNGVDTPAMWGGAGSAADLDAWPADVTAKSVRAFRQFLVAVNVTKNGDNYPHMIKWSHSADPGTVPDSWDETDPTKDAGEADLADTPGELVDALALGDSLIVYGAGAYYAIQDVGGTAIFRAQLISSEMGMLSQNCAAAFPRGHCVLGQGDVYVHAGGAPETILTSRARRWLFNAMDAAHAHRSFVVANPLANEVWICFPSVGSTACDTALVWNHQANTLGVRDLPSVRHGATGTVDSTLTDSWDALDEPWYALDQSWDQAVTTKGATRLVLAADRLLLADVRTGFSGAAMTATLERSGLAFGAPDTIKLCRGVRPIFEGSVGGQVDVSIGAAMDAQGPITWQPAVPFTIGTDLKADAFAAGRFLAVKFESAGFLNWRIKQMQFDVVKQGGY